MRLADLGLAVAALQALHGAELGACADALASLCEQHGQADAADMLERWAPIAGANSRAR
jgi:hypothetical protein